MGQGQSRAVNLPSPQNSSAPSASASDTTEDQPIYPDPKGNEYSEIDKLQAELPAIIDDESRQQVDDYIQACDGGKGPMVACFATGEYISMFERKVSPPREKQESIVVGGIKIVLDTDPLTWHPLYFQPRGSTERHLIYLRMYVIDH